MHDEKLIKNIKALIIFFTLIFLTIIGYLIYFNLYLSENIVKDPSNPRIRLSEEDVIRGSIMDRNGKTIAFSKKVKNNQVRIYNDGEVFAHVVGYNSPVYGKTGIELLYNDALQGNTFYYNILGSIFRKFVQTIEGEKRGSDVILTLDYELQKKAYRLLKDNKGALVVLNPKTGEILALVSKPSFDPEKVDKNFKVYKNDEMGNPFLNRAIQGYYPPGSTFKIVTLSAALENFNGIENKSFLCTGKLKIGDYILKDFNSEAHGRINLKKAFSKSCNFTFGSLGIELGYNNLLKEAEKFMFNKEINLEDLKLGKCQFNIEDKENKALLAQAAIGQHGVATNPLHMALVAATIANDGIMMKPYLVKEIKDEYGVVLYEKEPEILKRVIDKEIAKKVKEYMKDVVDKGTGVRAKLYNVDIAGKTGTAQLPNTDKTHAWFVGFAPLKDPKIAFAIIVEEGGTGGKKAAEIAKEIVKECLK
ncbi:Cell division protein FtsI/penicillin-binding protein 2 [Caloramator fervidus]|uniref:Cell division protein FtsI/penicillin-binding protein 2 n=2 Tax=Caloramator fervidus TaxID=29344 RepID=A0A1H5TAH4_9CLOT|nr:Cell division protein FtsI/penicillin-binding protein 2 [Caloramator fervidus]